MSGRRFTTHQHDNPRCKGLCVWPLRCDEQEKADRADREARAKAAEKPTPGLRFELVDDDRRSE